MIVLTVKDQVTPAMLRVMKRLQDLTPVMRSAGTTLLGIVQGMFNSVGADMRPIPWAPKRDGTPCILIKTGRLAHSFKLTSDARSATVSTDAPYAAVHQFGFEGSQAVKGHVRLIRTAFGRKLKFPVYQTVRDHQRKIRIVARPFFPVTADGTRLTPAAEDLVKAAMMRAIAGESGLVSPTS